MIPLGSPAFINVSRLGIEEVESDLRSIMNAYIPYMVKPGHLVVLQQND
jgi:hypothetical protein